MEEASLQTNSSMVHKVWDHFFVHCQGVEHEGDDRTERDWDLLKTNLFGYLVRSSSLRIDHVKGNSI